MTSSPSPAPVSSPSTTTPSSPSPCPSPSSPPNQPKTSSSPPSPPNPKNPNTHTKSSRSENSVGNRKGAYTCDGEGGGTPKSGAGGCAQCGRLDRKAFFHLPAALRARAVLHSVRLPVQIGDQDEPTVGPKAAATPQQAAYGAHLTIPPPKGGVVTGWKRGTCRKSAHNMTYVQQGTRAGRERRILYSLSSWVSD